MSRTSGISEKWAEILFCSALNLYTSQMKRGLEIYAPSQQQEHFDGYDVSFGRVYKEIKLQFKSIADLYVNGDKRIDLVKYPGSTSETQHKALYTYPNLSAFYICLMHTSKQDLHRDINLVHSDAGRFLENFITVNVRGISLDARAINFIDADCNTHKVPKYSEVEGYNPRYTDIKKGNWMNGRQLVDAFLGIDSRCVHVTPIGWSFTNTTLTKKYIDIVRGLKADRKNITENPRANHIRDLKNVYYSKISEEFISLKRDAVVIDPLIQFVLEESNTDELCKIMWLNSFDSSVNIRY